MDGEGRSSVRDVKRHSKERSSGAVFRVDGIGTLGWIVKVDHWGDCYVL